MGLLNVCYETYMIIGLPLALASIVPLTEGAMRTRFWIGNRLSKKYVFLHPPRINAYFLGGMSWIVVKSSEYKQSCIICLGSAVFASFVSRAF